MLSTSAPEHPRLSPPPPRAATGHISSLSPPSIAFTLAPCPESTEPDQMGNWSM
ncbi:MAG: hypothetical protein U0903_08350 [Planctomycetales bacterium]